MAGGSIRLGLTGGIGSGKSTFAAMLKNCGASIIDADAIARATTAPGGAAIAAIRQTFGTDFIDPYGALDRERMRTLAFTDASVRMRLQQIVHPFVHTAIVQAEAAAHSAAARLIVLDIPLLTESAHWTAQLDAVLVVDCLEDTQVQRVQQRSGLSPAAIHAIIAAQSSRSKRRAAADCLIYNEAVSLAELHIQAQQIAVWFGL